MGTKHKHAEVIKAWADGEEIELFLPSVGRWETIQDPSWSINLHYRVKPKNTVVKRTAWYSTKHNIVFKEYADSEYANIEYTFSPEGKLISTKVL